MSGAVALRQAQTYTGLAGQNRARAIKSWTKPSQIRRCLNRDRAHVRPYLASSPARASARSVGAVCEALEGRRLLTIADWAEFDRNLFPHQLYVEFDEPVTVLPDAAHLVNVITGVQMPNEHIADGAF